MKTKISKSKKPSSAFVESLVKEESELKKELEISKSLSSRKKIYNKLADIASILSGINSFYEPGVGKNLVARSFIIRRNLPNNTMTFTGLYMNRGIYAIKQPFRCILGVTYTNLEGTTLSIERITNVSANTTIRAGEEYETLGITVGLIYNSNHLTPRYKLELIVDSANDVSEDSNSDNYCFTTYWDAEPGFAGIVRY